MTNTVAKALLVAMVYTGVAACQPTFAFYKHAEMHFVEQFGDAAFRLDILPDLSSSFASRLTISCTDGCNSAVSLTEVIDPDTFDGAYSIGDGFVTLWWSGSSMFVRVYHVDKSAVTKVLDVRTKGQYPVFVTTQDGKRGIVVGNKSVGERMRDGEGGPESWEFPVFGELWVWNGKEYDLVPKTGQNLH